MSDSRMLRRVIRAALAMSMILTSAITASSALSAVAPSATEYTITRTVDLGGTTDVQAVAYDGTYVWSADSAGGTLIKLDPSTGSFTTTPLGTLTSGHSFYSVAVDSTYVWVVDASNNPFDTVVRLYRVTKSDMTVQPIATTVTGGQCYGPSTVQSDGTNIFVGCRSGQVVKMDLSGTVLAAGAFAVGPGTYASGNIELSGGSVWLGGSPATRFSASTLASEASLDPDLTGIGGTTESGQDATSTFFLYVMYPNPDTVVQFDKKTNAKVARQLPSPFFGSDVASDATTMWVSGLDATDFSTFGVWPMDLTTGTWGKFIAIPGGARGLTFAGTNLWVAAGSTLVEIGPKTVTTLYVAPSDTTVAYGGTPSYAFKYYSDASLTTEVTTPTITTAPTCSASTYTTAISPGTATITCSGGNPGSDYTFDFTKTATLTITTVSANVTASPASGNYTSGQSVTFGASVAASTGVGTCSTSGLVSLSFSTNPITGVAGTYPITSGAVDTTGWLAGTYTLTANYSGDGNCAAGFGTQTLTFTAPGTTGGKARGEGWNVNSGRRNNFAFNIESTSAKSTERRQLEWSEAGTWKFKGTLNSYTANNGVGTASGTGTLWYWVPSGRYGRWVGATSDSTTVTISFTATTARSKRTSGSPGSFGISFTGTRSPGVPALPNYALVTLSGGKIYMN